VPEKPFNGSTWNREAAALRPHPIGPTAPGLFGTGISHNVLSVPELAKRVGSMGA